MLSNWYHLVSALVTQLISGYARLHKLLTLVHQAVRYFNHLDVLLGSCQSPVGLLRVSRFIQSSCDRSDQKIRAPVSPYYLQVSLHELDSNQGPFFARLRIAP